MLTRDELLSLLARLAEETVVEPSSAFPFRVSRKKSGYSDDPTIARLQGKLSILLELEARR